MQAESNNAAELILGKSKADWRQLKKSISTLSQKAPQTLPLLQQIQFATTKLSLEQQDRKIIDFFLTEVAIPVCSTVLSSVPPESGPVRERLSLFIAQMAKCACKMYRNNTSTNEGVGEFLKTVMNPNSMFYKVKKTKQTEVGTQDKGAYENAPAYIPDPTVAIPLSDQPSTALAVIPQQPPEKPQAKRFTEQDDLLLPSYKQKPFKVVDRDELSPLGTQIIQIFLQNLQSLPLTFSTEQQPEYITQYLQVYQKLSPYLYTQYLRDMLPKILKSVWNYFITIDQQSIKGVTRKLLQSFFQHIEQLFDRVCMQKQKVEWLETFIVECTLRMIKSKTLQVKITGTKILSEVCNDVNLSVSKFIKATPHRDWMLKNKVYEEVVNLDSHEQVLQAASEIIKFLIRSNVFLLPELRGIFQMAEKATPAIEKLLIKPISEVSMRFYDPEAEYIQQWIRKHKEPWYEQLVDMLYYPSRYTSEALCHKGIDLFWQALLSYDNHPPAVSQRISRRYLQLLNGALDKGYLANPIIYATQMADRFISLKQIFYLKMLRKYIQMFPHSIEQTKYPTYKTTDFLIVKELIEVNGFLDKLLKVCSEKNGNNEQVMDCLTLLVLKYREHVSSEEYVSYKILLQLTNNSRLFNQLLFYFKEDSEVLFECLAHNTNTLQVFNCIKELFARINQSTLNHIYRNGAKFYELSCQPPQLKGYQQLFTIILTSPSLKVRQQAAQFLCSLYSNKQPAFSQFIDQVLVEIQRAYKNSKESELLGYCILLESMMNETQTKGVGLLVPHISLVNTESVRVIVNNQATYGFYLPRKYQQKFPANKTLFELLVEVGHCFKCSPNDIILKYNQVEIKQTCNGLSIEELGLRDCELVAAKRQRDAVPKVPLIDGLKLSERATQVFTEIFFRFSQSGKMTPAELAKFVSCSTKDDCDANDSRVSDTFKKFDENKDNILELSDFLAFFEDSCKFRQGTVWRNLEALLYRPDLRKEEDVTDSVDYKKMARYKLCNQPSSYQMLFNLTQSQNKELKENATKLLKRLPTSKAIIDQMLNKIQFDVKEPFAVWYRLALVQYLLQGQGQASPQAGIYTIDPAKVKEWKQKFSNAHLYLKILSEAERIAKQPLSKLSDLSRNCLALCLQILRSLNDIPRLDKPLPQNPQLKLIEIPSTNLVIKLIPELYETMIGELYEPVLCLLLLRKQPLDVKLLEKGIFYPDKQVRLMTCNFFYLYQRRHKFSLNLFNIKVGKNCQEYFSMLVKFLFEDDKLDLKAMLKTTVQDIKKHEVSEGISTSKHDQLFLGKLEILQNILILEPNLLPKDNKIQELLLAKLDRTLSQQNLQVLYRLLLRTNLDTVVKTVYNYISLLQPRKATQPKAFGYVGIVNLGCICYMNAVLQQLFMTPEFRYPILSLDLSSCQLQTKQRNGRKYAESVLFEFQKMFSYLQLSQRGDYNPECFCYSFDSNIQFRNQQDCQQFLSTLFDKLQKQLKQTTLKKLLHSVYGGQTISTILCESCNTPTYREQEFYDLSLEMKGMKSLNECLDKMVESEPIEGYYCEKCEKKVTTSKSTHLYRLPNTLIVHLQRITYSYDTFTNVKIHHSLSFPNSLNLSKYVKVREDEDKPAEQQCQYELKGVIIHSGQANQGHYYSLIKDAKGSWLKFDDSRVTPFGSNQIQEESFGGKHQYQEWAYSSHETRSKNAYMLVYDKKIKKENVQEQKVIAKALPEKLNSEILNDNNNVFFRELQFTHKGFFKFIKHILQRLPFSREIYQQYESCHSPFYSEYQSIPAQTRLSMINLMSMLHKVVDIVSKSTQIDELLIKQIAAYLSLLYFVLPDMAQLNFLNYSSKKFIQSMISDPNLYIRDLNRMIVNRSISIVVAMNGVNLQKDQTEISGKVLEYLDNILGMMTELHKNNTRMKQYFQFWKVFGYQRPTFMDYCFQKQFLTKLVSFLLQKKSPTKEDWKQPINEEWVNRSATPILQLLAALVANSGLDPTTEPRYMLTEQDKKFLTIAPFYKQMIESQSDLSGLIAIITNMSLHNKQFSQQIAKLLLNGINSSSNWVFNYMTVVRDFLDIDDEFHLHRLGWVLGIPQLMSEGHDDYSLRASLHSQVYTYISSLDVKGINKSVLELLFLQRKNPDRSSIMGVHILLDLLHKNQRVLRYVASLPPPNYFYAKYTDWIEEFNSAFKEDKHLILDVNREKQAETCSNLLKSINTTINRLMQTSQLNEQPLSFQILPALMPTYIIGKNHHLQFLPQMDLSTPNLNISIKPTVHYTYILKSQPTGVNNVSLPRQTFNTINLPIDKEKERNKLVKIFTYNPGVVEQSDEPVPQYRPTVITIEVNCNVPIKLDLTHPTFRHEVSLPSGKTKLNVPYTLQPVHNWLCVHPESLSMPEPQPSTTTAGTSTAFDSQYYDEMAGIPCPICTFENFQRKTCEMCDAVL